MKSEKGKKQLIPTQKSVSPEIRAKIDTAVRVAKESEAKIKKGLSKPDASTGTPIKILHGGARFTATLSNIGGGSRETGGGGMEDGLATILDYDAAVTTIKALSPEPPQSQLGLPE